ncbi:MAG: phenylalanine--tRNA ligase subunit alpha [Thaumarchaeota archaeon]|nr:phenylalanine--tRNA ligase subunit alpha [Nitrososphaerota archaeon]
MSGTASALHPLERRLLSTLSAPGSLDFDSLVREAGLQVDQVRRALSWLSSKGLVETNEAKTTSVEMGAKVPPELLLFEKVQSSSGAVTLESLRGSFESADEFSAALGRARGHGWIKIDQKSSPPAVSVEDSRGPKAMEAVIEAVRNGEDQSLSDDQSRILVDLLRRGLVRQDEKTVLSVSITSAGRIAAPPQTEEYLDRLTPAVLATGAWRGKSLRPIDVEAKAPVFYPGRRHPVRDFIREVKEAYISMGFTELEGESVHPAFWNFDALFIPQDHPGREMQDTFYIEGMSDKKLARSGVVDRVAATHENGWRTGSRGWGGIWRVEEARRLVLRTHNTVLTVKALSESKDKETRVFAVSKVYRNENLDYKHLHEFYQMDGIMVGEGLNVRHLMGFLKEFYKKLGMKDVKLWPSYFPYTEPSLQVMGYSDVAKDWVELGGSGVFRPEVTLPLGVKVPVLAWGPGIERLMLLRFGMSDLRELYGNDLSWLRSRPEIAGS